MLDFIELKKFLRILNDTGISYFVSGGVALDGLRGKISRKHQDLDVYVFERDLTQLFRQLKARGYRCFRKLNKFEVRGKGILVDILPLVSKRNTMYLKGNVADTRFPKEVFEKPLEGRFSRLSFRVVPGEIFALEMPYSTHPDDKKYAASIPYNKKLFGNIKSVQKNRPSDIVLEAV